MGVRAIKMCCECKEKFRREKLIDYAPEGTKTIKSYCPDCLKKKHEREQFSNKVCQIFGTKSPGPRIWTERQRLFETYGYTDDIIIECLDYIYNVEKKKKKVESLCLINPLTVERMKKYKKTQVVKANQLVRSMTLSEFREHIVSIKEEPEKKKEEWDSDKWLED